MSRGQIKRRISFNDRTLKALKPPDRAKGEPPQIDYFDSTLPGFGLRISYRGRKSFIVIYRVNGKKGRLTIGRFDLLSLADARETARDALRDALRGIDPAAAKRDGRSGVTFKTLSERYIEEYAKPRKVTWKKDERLLNRNVVPELGSKLAKAITRADVRGALRKIRARAAPVESNRTQEVLHKLFAWAIEEEILQSNPVAGIKTEPEGERDRHLSADEISEFWKATDELAPVPRGVLRMMLLSAQRRNEVAHMRWEDLDRRDWWWNIPAEFTKTKRPYRVPISDPMRALIEEMQGLELDDVWVFPRATGGAPATETTVTRPFRTLIKAAGIAHFVPHDLVHTVSSGMTSIGITQFIVGKVRHHEPSGKKPMTARYDHYQYDREKRAALDTWAQRLTEIIEGKQAGSNVVQLA